MKRAPGSLRGSVVYRPRWSVRITSASASIRFATSAPSVSLSPNLISSLTTVSFSLITGTTLRPSSVTQGRARIQVALAIGEVGVREQHLRTAQTMGAQLRLVDLRQAHLAHGGSCLQLVDFMRTHGPAQALHALGDRAARDHHHLAALAASVASWPHQWPTAVASRPRPSSVTRLEPTLTTTRLAAQRLSHARLRGPLRRRRRRRRSAGRASRRPGCASCATCS
jgi:hypothetical protein